MGQAEYSHMNKRETWGLPVADNEQLEQLIAARDVASLVKFEWMKMIAAIHILPAIVIKSLP
jgi:hypothetical protein